MFMNLTKNTVKGRVRLPFPPQADYSWGNCVRSEHIAVKIYYMILRGFIAPFFVFHQ
jgi:hypothetical protein